ncbi:MAG: signal peptidase I [Candidatus Thiodiazotropha endolucinida]|nr:signal peptidase I [Candidatus Thiodiazotropha taylori]MCW4223829.1 signal peptidase I [Candidatus Thiodiazotropha endolucinida]MCG7880746.1 signal peptidase I [Candidatus Thiodiazotropha taylori]MCG7885407.1 signal peptidase I [Candidatus Thiodiazotropha taylori]MCG8030224.1 signal peptidase I [Candidatus Thiodiazotropha taylori]
MKRVFYKYYTHKNVIMLMMGISIITLFNIATSRYRIAIDFESIRCIQEYSIYLVDKHDKEPKRNHLYMFNSKNLLPIYPKNTKMLKYLRGMPGDTVTIDHNDNIYIENQYIATGLSLAKSKLGQSKNTFRGTTVLQENQYWFLGTSSHSFDSRYWGTVKQSDILGRAYGLL